MFPCHLQIAQEILMMAILDKVDQDWMDGQKLLSDKIHLFISNNSWVWYYDLSMVLCLRGCYTVW